MKLPYGTLASSRRGPADLEKLGEGIAKESLTGYLRVSVFDRSAVNECVIIYNAGRPVMSFASDGTADRQDPGLGHMSEAIRKDNAIVEICLLQEKQVKLLQDVYREFAAAPAAAPPKPVVAVPPRAAATVRRVEKASPVKAPEIRGRFVRAEEIAHLEAYLQRHPGETGHLLFMAQTNGRQEEHHIVIIQGRIETVYNDRAAGPELLEALKGVPGQAEFYAVEEALLTSVVGRLARTTGLPATEKEKPAPERLALERQSSGIGISARDLLDARRPMTSPARDDISRAMDEISSGMDDDIAMMRKVEREFAGHVDELLFKLELSHLRSGRKGRRT
jgi:hypothetical protein